MKRISCSFLGNFTFLLGALLIASMGVVLYKATADTREASAQTRLAQDIVTTLDEITEQAVRAESNQRGFRLTGTEAFIEARDRDQAKADASVAQLASLLAGRRVQLQEVRKLAGIRCWR